jgi:hypothetical protein
MHFRLELCLQANCLTSCDELSTVLRITNGICLPADKPAGRACRFLDLLTMGDPDAQRDEEGPKKRRRRRRRGRRAFQPTASDTGDGFDAEDDASPAAALVQGETWAANADMETEEGQNSRRAGRDAEANDNEDSGLDAYDIGDGEDDGDFADMHGRALLSCGMKVRAALTPSGRLALTGEEKHICALRAQQVMRGQPDFVHVMIPATEPDEPPENEVRLDPLPIIGMESKSLCFPLLHMVVGIYQ